MAMFRFEGFKKIRKSKPEDNGSVLSRANANCDIWISYILVYPVTLNTKKIKKHQKVKTKLKLNRVCKLLLLYVLAYIQFFMTLYNT